MGQNGTKLSDLSKEALCLLLSHSVVPSPLWPHGPQHASLPHPSLSPGACSNSYPLSWWCHPTISSSVVPFSSCPQSFLASGFFSNESALHIRWPKYWISASASVLPMNIQDWSPLGWTGWISLQSKGLSRVFSSTTVWKHQFFNTQLSLSGSYFGSITECLQEGQVLELVTGSEVLSQCSHLFTRKMLLLSSVCC